MNEMLEICRLSAWVGLEKSYRQFLPSAPIRRILEVGVACGYSLFYLAMDFPEAEVIGVDGNTGSPLLQNNVGQFKNVRLLQATSAQAEILLEGQFDLIHIDATHTAQAMQEDFDLWMPRLTANGCIMFHDINEDAFPDCRAWWSRLPGRKHTIREHHGLGFWYKS